MITIEVFRTKPMAKTVAINCHRESKGSSLCKFTLTLKSAEGDVFIFMCKQDLAKRASMLDRVDCVIHHGRISGSDAAMTLRGLG